MKRAIILSFLMTILISIINSSWSQSSQVGRNQNSKLRQTWEWILRHNSRFTIPFEKFAADMKDKTKRYQTYQWLLNHNPDFTVSFEKFSIDILESAGNRVNVSRSDGITQDSSSLIKRSLCAEADSLAKVEEFERAIYVYTIVIDTKEPCEMPHFSRGSCKASVGDYRGAIDDLKIYLDSVRGLEHKGVENEDNPFTIWHVQLAYLMIGNCYLSLGNVEEGCLSYGKAGEYGSEEAYRYMKESCN